MSKKMKYCLGIILSAAVLLVSQPASAGVIGVTQGDLLMSSTGDFLNTGTQVLAVNVGDTVNDRTVNGIAFEKYVASHSTAKYTIAGATGSSWGIGTGWSNYFESGPNADAEADGLMTSGVYLNSGGTLTLHELTPGAGYRLQIATSLDQLGQLRTYGIQIEAESPLDFALDLTQPKSRVFDFTATTSDVVLTFVKGVNNIDGPVISAFSLFETQPVPEPSACVLMGLATLGFRGFIRRSRKR